MDSIKHVAIIMDGNGRWAQKRSHKRVWGHIRGASVVTQIIETADEIGIESLTLYAFSTENWTRPIEEISTLMKLLKKFLIKEKNRILKNNIIFKVIGSTKSLPTETRQLIEDLEKMSEGNTGLRLNFAFSYGSRSEIISSVNNFIERNPNKLMSIEDMENGLYTRASGDVDLLIRTGGDLRISNFLLWQCSYAEFFFTDTPWPEFSTNEFEKIIENCRHRERRFGGVGKSIRESQNSKILNGVDYV